MPKSKDIFSKHMFEDRVQAEPAKKFTPDGQGNYIDELGNTVDGMGQIIKEAPSPDLLEARRLYPDLDDNQLAPYVADLKRQRLLKEKLTSRKN